MFQKSLVAPSGGDPTCGWLPRFLARYFVMTRLRTSSEVAFQPLRCRRRYRGSLDTEDNGNDTLRHRRAGQSSTIGRTASFFPDWPWYRSALITERPLKTKVFSGGIGAIGLDLECRSPWRMRKISTTTGEHAQPDAHRSSCGLSYSQFVRKCSECLTDRQLERVAMRLKAYKGLKKAPRTQNKLTVVRDIGKIAPRMTNGHS